MSETVEKIQLLETVRDRRKLLGVWRLTYKLTNRMGPGGFTARMLDSYTDPLTGRPRHLYNENGIQQPGYMITKQTTILEPRTSRHDAHIVDFLLGHPSVFVEKEHGDLDPAYLKVKQSNPRITLVNLDHQDLDAMEDEDFIDKLVGTISLDKGANALGIEKLRFILAKLNMTYREAKYINDSIVEKTRLRKRLKDYVRKGKKQAEEVIAIIDNLERARYEYELKEAIRTKLITNNGGVYRYKEVSIGSTTDSAIEYLTNNQDLYGEIMAELYKILKAEAS